MPIVWGGVHVGEGPGDHLAARHPLRARTESWCGGTRPAGGAGKTTANADRSPRPSRRSRRGRGPPGGCAPRSARRSVTRPARCPRSPPPTGCRGRPRTAPSSPTPRPGWPSREPTRVLRHRRDPPRQAPLGTLRGDRAVGAGRSVGHRVRRPGRLPGPARATRGPHRRRRHRLAHAAHAAVPRGRRVRGDRPSRGLRHGDPHAGAVAQRDDRGRPLPPGRSSPTTR